MSLETLLEAAEFLEWNKPGGKKSSRATRNSKKAEKYKPHVLTERKRKAPSARSSASAKVSASISTVSAASTLSKDHDDYELHNEMEDIDDETTADETLHEEEQQKITLKEIRKSLGNRETHNKLEKNRRAHLKECFEQLRRELPLADERRTSNLSTLRSALRLIENLAVRQKDMESEKKRMQRLKNTRQAQINSLRKELQDKGVEYNIDDWIEGSKTSTNSTNTASECGEAVVTETIIPAVQPRTLQTAPGLPEVQVLIKAMPPQNSASSSSNTLNYSDNLGFEAPLQTVHLVPQTALAEAAQQRLRVQAAPTAGTFINRVVLPSLNTYVPPRTATVSAHPHQLVSVTAAQVPQVVTVAKLSQSNGTSVPTRILLTPKVMPQQTAVTTLSSAANKPPDGAPAAQFLQPQYCSVGPGEVIISSAPGVTPTTASFYITSSPAANQQLQMQHQPSLAVSAESVGAVGSAPLMLNLQTGRIHGQAVQSHPHLIYNKAAMAPVPVTTVEQQTAPNMNIAPKQLVIITTGAASTTQPVHKVQGRAATVAVTSTPGEVHQQTAMAVPPGVTLLTGPTQNSLYQQQPHHTIYSTAPNTPTAGTVISLSQLRGLSSLRSVTTLPASNNPVTPTIITGMLPTTGADGTVTYVPIQLTAAKPAASAAAATAASHVPSRLPPTPIAGIAGVHTVSAPANTPSSTPVAADEHTSLTIPLGATFVLPPSATGIGSNSASIQLVAGAPSHSPQLQHQQRRQLVTVAQPNTIQLSSIPSSVS